MRARATVLISNYTYKYEGTIVMQTDDETQLKNLEKALDRSLTALDSLRCKTDEEEKQVLRLLREQRLLQEKRN